MLYLGIVFFLLLDRFLVVLCPLQIGRITNILANNGNYVEKNRNIPFFHRC